jgi:lysyl-tRNA synthetase class 1
MNKSPSQNDKDTVESQFWADATAAKIAAERHHYVVASGITPSGEIHVGNLREVLTAHTISLALEDLGKKTEFIFVSDNMDPLRHVYPFLDAKIYEQHVGKPLSNIPCPCGKHQSYAHHFVEPFVASLAELGMHPRIVGANELYQRPEFAPIIMKALKHRDRIAKILHEQTGKVIEDDWYPYNPICNRCGKINSTTVKGFDEKRQTVSYDCKCGDSGEVSVIGGGKLTWRVDWPARWCLLQVTMEPFGKDHGTRGGSYDTGKIISKEIFGYEPPYPLMYEWISLKGLGDMSSSKGNVVSVHEMLTVLPADILRYFILRVNPIKSVTLDPGLPMLNLVDDYDNRRADGAGNKIDRAIQLAQVSGFEPLGVPFRHLVTMVQICGTDVAAVRERLKHTGYEVSNIELLKKRIQLVTNWLKRFAPEDVKFSLQPTLPATVAELSLSQKSAMHKLAEQLPPTS